MSASAPTRVARRDTMTGKDTARGPDADPPDASNLPEPLPAAPRVDLFLDPSDRKAQILWALGDSSDTGAPVSKTSEPKTPDPETPDPDPTPLPLATQAQAHTATKPATPPSLIDTEMTAPHPNSDPDATDMDPLFAELARQLAARVQEADVTTPILSPSPRAEVAQLTDQINALLALANRQIALSSDHAARLEQRADAESRKVALLTSGIGDGVWIWDILNNSLEISRGWCQTLGYDGSEITAIKDLLDRLHPEDSQTVRAGLRQHMETGSDHFRATYRIRAQDGSHRWMSCRAKCVRDQDERPTLMVGSMRDVHEAQTIDPVTGLLNDRAFGERLTAALSRRDRLCVMIVGVPQATRIRDGLSTSDIDAMRKSVAQRVSGSLPFDAVLARLTGDNHGVLLPVGPSGESHIREVAAQVADAFSQPFLVAGGKIWLDAVIGASPLIIHPARPPEILRDAWTSYRLASQNGTRFNLLDEAQKDDSQRRIEMERDVRDALEYGWFAPYLQPIIDLETGTVRGFEALVRMLHPDIGIVSPGRFLSVAQDIGLKADISLKILDQALDLLEQWTADPVLGGMFVSVNLDPEQMMHDSFPREIEQRLWDKGVQPCNLKLELVESSIIGSFSQAARQIRELREIGVKIALDDFGTGYSSLEYLSQLDVDLIKIDKSFVDGMEHDQRKQTMVKTICLLSDSLGAELCMEGVETEAQNALAREYQIDMIQGYLYSKPLPVDAAIAFARNRHKDAASSLTSREA